jgi:hypothetical protein
MSECETCKEQNGISKKARLIEPGILLKGWNLAKTMAQFATSGFALTSREMYDKRLAICDACPMHRGHKCLACGCYLPVKAAMAVAECPDGRWPGQAGQAADEPAARSFEVSDNGDITGTGVTMPEGWSNDGKPPWEPCKYRRVSVTYTNPPVVVPFCTLFNKPVSGEVCRACGERVE